MKRIEAIARPSKVNDVYAALERVSHPGMMVSEIEGHGKTKGVEQQVRGKTCKVDFIAKARMELVVEDAGVNDIVSAIQKAVLTGMGGFSSTPSRRPFAGERRKEGSLLSDRQFGRGVRGSLLSRAPLF
jgi:nitrogen regulatory protein P-II 1